MRDRKVVTFQGHRCSAHLLKLKEVLGTVEVLRCALGLQGPVGRPAIGNGCYIPHFPPLTLVTGRIMAAQDVNDLTFRPCEYVALHGKRDFADVMKSREMGR